MKRKILFLCSIVAGILSATSNPVYAQDETFHVFACEPEWASLAKEIGGDHVDAFSATTAQQDPHHVRAKPSLISAMRKADMVVCSGAELEVGWLPILLEKAGNRHTVPGSDGYLLAASKVGILEKPTRVDRADGDVHPEGNPHIHLNPHNIARVAAEMLTRLSALDPDHAEQYKARYQSFSKRWNEAMARWEREGKELRNVPVIVHHKSFAYLLNWLNMQEVGSLEPKPGLPPTSAHLESLLRGLNTQPAKMILRTAYEPSDASEWLADKSHMPAITLPYTIGGNEQSQDLFGLFDSTLALLKEANHAKQ